MVLLEDPHLPSHVRLELWTPDFLSQLGLSSGFHPCSYLENHLSTMWKERTTCGRGDRVWAEDGWSGGPWKTCPALFFKVHLIPAGDNTEGHLWGRGYMSGRSPAPLVRKASREIVPTDWEPPIPRVELGRTWRPVGEKGPQLSAST